MFPSAKIGTGFFSLMTCSHTGWTSRRLNAIVRGLRTPNALLHVGLQDSKRSFVTLDGVLQDI